VYKARPNRISELECAVLHTRRMRKCLHVLGLSCAFVAAVAAAQTPFRNVAAYFSGERKDDVLSKISKAMAVKEFSPMLKDSPDSAGYVIAAFVLAMKGVDLDGNLARLVVPIKDAHNEKIEELTATHGLAENQILLEDVPNAIYQIYKTQHYLPALKTLFTMPVDWPAAEYRDDCVMAQLRSDPKPVMAMAAGDKKIYATLWDIVDWNVGAVTDRKIFIHRMQTARWTTPAMKRVALQLAHDLATPRNRPQKTS
jgi:hypothetical protein